jgi:hypothetical protein
LPLHFAPSSQSVSASLLLSRRSPLISLEPDRSSFIQGIITMNNSHQNRFASMFAAIFCAVVTIGFSVAPVVSPLSGMVA